MANTHSIALATASSQYLSVADTASLSITGDLTLEMWVKFESLTTTNHLLSKYNPTGDQRGYTMHTDGTSGIRFVTSTDGTAGTVVSTALAYTFSTATWYHIALVYTASAGTAQVYINGSSIGTMTSQNTSLYDNTSDFAIGSRGDGAEYFDGLIDDVRVWNDIRTGSEISTNYQTELVGTEANLQGYWKLNNGLLDETTNNNDLTNNGSATFSTDIPFPVASSFTPKVMIF